MDDETLKALAAVIGLALLAAEIDAEGGLVEVCESDFCGRCGAPPRDCVCYRGGD